MRFWWWLLLLPTVALAKTENWPERYDTGVTAYRSNDFARGFPIVRERERRRPIARCNSAPCTTSATPIFGSANPSPNRPSNCGNARSRAMRARSPSTPTTPTPNSTTNS